MKKANRGVTVPKLLEKLIEMRAVGFHDLLAMQEPSEKGEGRVVDDIKQQERYDKKRGVGTIVAGGYNRQHRKGKTQKGTSHVAHKDLSRRKVINQKTQRPGNDRVGQDINQEAALHQGYHTEKNAGNKRDATHQTVQAIHEIKGVRQSQYPQKGDGVFQPVQADFPNHGNIELVNNDANGQNADNGYNLREQFYDVRFILYVVIKRDNGDQQR